MLGLAEPITLVLDNARYQRNAVVQGLATKLGFTLLYLPSYSPNMNLIERLWRVHQTSRLRLSIPSHLRRVSAPIQEVREVFRRATPKA